MVLLRSLARTGVPFLASPPGMSKKGVAQLIPFSGYRHSANIETLKSGFAEPLFRGAQDGLAAFPALSEVNDSAFEPDHGGVCPVVGAELGEYVLDVALHGFLRDGKLRGDFFVGVSARDQAQNLNFA